MSPLMDRDQFPTWRYDRAGVMDRKIVQPRDRWIGRLLEDLIDWGRRAAGLSEAPALLFGHSAGGQMLSRVAAYCPPPGVARLIIANPSVYVVPSLSEPAPHGFANLFGADEAETRLRTYLALPISIYLGREDVGAKNLVDNAPARRQGVHRLDRGRHVFSRAEHCATSRLWPFGWRLVEAEGVGHSASGMLDAPEMLHALGLESRA